MPSPIRPTTGRSTPLSRPPSATPTAAGVPQPMPPLAVAKNDPVLTVGSHSTCWAMVEVDSLTMTASGGLTRLRAA
jgi:hypothetical protein